MSTKRKRKRRVFSEEFKRDAVNLVVVEGDTIAAAARAVNVLDGSLRDWHRKYAPEPEPCGEDASVAERKAECKQLRDAEIEREILKKATAYFAKESQ